MAERNIAEYSFLMKMSKITLCQQDDLNTEQITREFNENYPCHIYFISKRPRVFIIPEKCILENRKMILTFGIQKQFNVTEHKIIIKDSGDYSNFKLKSDYPYNYFEIYENGKLTFNAKSSLFFNQYTSSTISDLDMELLYIGQSYGKKGERIPPERLVKHSTLQKIYSDAIQKNPDSEIWLSLLSFEKLMLTNIDGINKYTESNENKSINSASKVLAKFINNDLTEKQVINFTEAALIKYFKPKYNIEYKDTFPKSSHTTYKECYDLDVNSVAIELNTECIKTKFYTELMERAYLHLGSFTMRGRDQRISMFDICDNSFERKNLSIKVE